MVDHEVRTTRDRLQKHLKKVIAIVAQLKNDVRNEPHLLLGVLVKDTHEIKTIR
jgi:hypothetical protein